MNSIRFKVPIDPKGQPRHKHRVVAQKVKIPIEDFVEQVKQEKLTLDQLANRVRLIVDNIKKPFAQAYAAPEGVALQKVVKGFAAAAMSEVPFPYLEGPIKCTLGFVFQCPKSYHRKTKPAPREWHTKRPDIDNLEKLILDACTDVVYADDKQVCKVVKYKIRAAQGEPARTEVIFEELEAIS